MVALGASHDAPPGQLVAQKEQRRWRLGRAQPPGLDGSFLVTMDDGTQRTVPRLPMNMKKVVEGSLDHAVAADPEALRSRFERDPTDVVAWLLSDTRTPMNKGEIERKLADLLLPLPADWWPKVSKGLKSHAHVVSDGPRYSWSDVAVEKAPRATSPRQPRAAQARRSPAFGEVVTSYRDGESEVPAASAVPRALPSPGPVPQPAPSLLREVSAEPVASPPSPPTTDTRGDNRVLKSAVEALLHERSAPTAGLQQIAATELGVTRELARALQRMAAPSTPLELTDVDVASLPAPLRYDLGRLALRRRSFPAFVQCVLAVDPADVGRLTGRLPVEEPLLEALVAALERRPRIDARAADRFEQVLRRVLEQGSLPADLVPAALSFLGSLARVPALGDHPSLLQAGQALLDDCLSGRRARPAVATADRTALIALTTSALVQPAVDPRERWVKLVLALDDADRSDVLGQMAVWTRLDVKTLTDRPRLAELLQRRALDDHVARPLLQGAAEDPSSADVLRLLAVPDALLRLLPAQLLAGHLQRLAQDDTTLAQVLILLTDRIQAARDRESGDEAIVQLRQASAEVERLNAQLAAEQQAHDRTRSRLNAMQQEERAADAVAVTQARSQALRLAVDVAEELRLATLVTDEPSALRRLTDIVTALLAAEGLQAWGRTDEVLPYDPTSFRVLGEDVLLAAGQPAVVVRPAYVLSEGETTVLRYGDVRPAGA